MSLKGTSYLTQPVGFNLAAATLVAGGSAVAQFTAPAAGMFRATCNAYMNEVIPADATITMWLQSAADGLVASLVNIPSTVGPPCALINTRAGNMTWTMPCVTGSMYAVVVRTGAAATVESGLATFQLL